MGDEDVVKRVKKVLDSREVEKEVREVYELVKKLIERINKVKDVDDREGLFFSTIDYLSKKIDIDLVVVVSILEIVKHGLIREYLDFGDLLKARLLRGERVEAE